MAEEVTYEVDPGGLLRSSLRYAASQVDDLTIPLVLITKSWYQGNKAIWQLKSPGKYQDYKNAKNKAYSPYKRWKEREFGSAYPMLFLWGALKESMTNPTDQGAINQIINKKSLILGTKVPEAPYLQLGTKFMVARPFMFIGGEQQAPGLLQQRRDTWLNIIQNYVNQCTGARTA